MNFFIFPGKIIDLPSNLHCFDLRYCQYQHKFYIGEYKPWKCDYDGDITWFACFALRYDQIHVDKEHYDEEEVDGRICRDDISCPHCGSKKICL